MKQRLQSGTAENFREGLNHQILTKYGTRLTIGSVKEMANKRYEVLFSYNKVFHIIDELNKTVYVRNIYFENIYGLELSSPQDLDIPVRELNRAINNKFVGLRNSLFHRVISNKEIIISVLRYIHPTSAFLNKFYTLLIDLVYSDIIDKDKLAYYYRTDDKYKKYIELIINSKLAEYAPEGGLKASSQFKKLLEQHKRNPTEAVEEAVYKTVCDNYEYIVYELGLPHIKSYVNVISSLFYLYKYQTLDNISIRISELRRIHQKLFGKISEGKFQERINSLVISGVFARSADAVQLALPA